MSVTSRPRFRVPAPRRIHGVPPRTCEPPVGTGCGSREPAASERVRPTLLVVDDERDMLRSVHDLLRIDYRVVTYQRGAEALEFLRSAESVHVILSDQRMPEMTGVEVLRQAKAIRPETTRLLFTAYTDIHTVIDAINQGHVFRYLAKPCDPDVLAAVVRQAVEHHNLIVEKNRLLAELQETNARLIEANRLKGAFIEVASHELNTPVTVVLGMIELWKMSQGQSASPTERQWVDRIGAAAGRLARTVERMLKLVRNREFSQSLDTRADRAGAARAAGDRGAVPLSRAAAPDGDRRHRAEPGPIEADSSKISDVLINLLANAVKFTPDGGTIRLEARPSRRLRDWVRVSSQRPGGGGFPGRPAAPLRAVLHRLRHAPPLLRRLPVRQARHRLGLWLVKTFVELHGGRVEVSSTPGAGSTFAFVLPRSQAVLSSG